jgi:hypothetical protein
VHDNNQILLPFAEKEYIDVKRAARILGVSISTVYNLEAAHKIEIIDFRYRGRKRVRYQSIVDFCDALRIRHCIADRRPQLSHAIFRHRDEDLLPFPISDTISTETAMGILGYESTNPIVAMCQEGRFDAYKLLADASPWRISKISFARYVKSLHEPDPASRAKCSQPVSAV